HVEVCALREMTSTDLIAACDEYTDLGSIRNEVALDAPPPREIRNEIQVDDDFNSSSFKVQDTSFDF
ncbi:MAG TPA: hypothetical protein PLQ13_10610, partial [Candidatus Krumholzibacteria bacterium]|nr:hypothetical protein [Candidatus Krumholzibacteria bacterium]